VLWVFISLKNPTPQSGSNLGTLGPVASTLTIILQRQLVRGLFITLMMDAVITYDMPVSMYFTAQQNIPEDSHVCTHHHEILKSHLY
jgi:hypothetical protein